MWLIVFETRDRLFVGLSDLADRWRAAAAVKRRVRRLTRARIVGFRIARYDGGEMLIEIGSEAR